MHLTAILMLSTHELITDLSYSDSPLEKSTFTHLTTSLQSSQRYAYLKHYQTLKLFLTILHRLISSSPIKPVSTIPDAPPLPSDISPATEVNTEDTFGISSLFDEISSPTLTNTGNNQPTIYRSLSSSHRKRTILNRCLEMDVCSEEYFDQDDHADLLNYLDKNYFNENIEILLDDLKATLNNKEQIENLAILIQQSITLPRFIHNLLQNEILTETNENLLLEQLGISFEQSWPISISINPLILLLKIILKRKNNDLICSLWEKFLQSISHSTEQISLEHLDIFLVFFHQLTIPQRKTILLGLVQQIQSTKENISLLILFEYIMYNFYEIPAEIIENIQQIISKTDPTLTNTYNQIVSKNSSTTLDGFALKTLYNNSIYNQFYNYLIEQLDFTKINKNESIKQYYDLLWRILGYLPPSPEFLENMNNYTNTTHLLHLFRLEKKLSQDKYLNDFLGKEINFKDIQWFKHIEEIPHSLFDLIVYEILFQNLPSTSEDINRLYRIFVHELRSSLNKK